VPEALSFGALVLSHDHKQHTRSGHTEMSHDVTPGDDALYSFRLTLSRTSRAQHWPATLTCTPAPGFSPHLRVPDMLPGSVLTSSNRLLQPPAAF